MTKAIPTSDALAVLNEGPLTAPLEQAQQRQQVGAARVVRAEEASVLDNVSAAVKSWDTVQLGQAAYRSIDRQTKMYDPDWDIAAQGQKALKDYGLADTRFNREYLRAALDGEELADLAQDLKERQERADLLEQNWGYGLITALDPGLILADLATFGASRTFRLGRLASGVLGATGSSAYLAGVEASGVRDVDTTEYLLNAAIAGGANALFGGEVANGIARGDRNWFGGINPNAAIRDGINEFTTEVDKLVVNDAAKDVLIDIIDDPVRRDVQNGNASSVLRKFRNEADAYKVEYEQELSNVARQVDGISYLGAKFDLSGRYTLARDRIEAEVAQEMLRRNSEYLQFGDNISPSNAPAYVQKLADAQERAIQKIQDIARRAGLEGMEDLVPQPGYFHRQWEEKAFLKMEQMFRKADGTADRVRGRKFQRELMIESLRSGAKLTREEAKPIAQAMLTRMDAKRAGTKTDFLGGLGKADTEAIREMLVEGGVAEPTIKSIMTKLEGRVEGAGKVKYAKSRLPFDMTTSIQVPLREGSNEFVTLSMSDLISKDLSRLLENYAEAITGRSALAQAGVGGSDAAIAARRKAYAEAIAGDPKAEERLLTFDFLMSDFTGIRPAQGDLSQMAQRFKSFAGSTMLSASGIWQTMEYATLAYRYGVGSTMKEAFKAMPGFRKAVETVRRNPDLYDEARTVLNLDLARDVRIHPWLKQHEAFVSSADSTFDRLLHAGKQATPYLNAMKFIHSHQARMNTNLALNRLVRAANGDTKAIKMFNSYGLKGAEFDKVMAAAQRNCDTYGKNARSMNWAGWTQDEIDSAMNAVLRVADDTILYGRAGQGASYARSGVGQILGQFTQFVSFAHNKMLRGTLRADGARGLAVLFAYQYPFAFLATLFNETRKGNLDDKGIEGVARTALGYTSALGFFSDAFGILGITGQSSSRSVPVLGLFNTAGRAAGGVSDILAGDVAEGAFDITKAAATSLPGIAAMPGTAILLDAIKPEK